ncbi:MAG: DUF58 domain-containing protein [Psychrosphaera sp.]|nr:DUF58 domain-containing protein [Psychrosphaera sp.]
MNWWQKNSPTAAADVSSWLQDSRSNGVTLCIEELLAYQQKCGMLDLSPRHTNQSKLAGNYLAKSKGRGMEFDEVRHYNPGDDIRTIDWRVTARTGTTHTKLFREEKERPIFILVDLSDSMYFGTRLLFKSVQAAHLAALIAWNAKKRGDKVGGLVFNQHKHRELKPKSRQHGVLQVLHGLTMLHEEGIEKVNHPLDTPKIVEATNNGKIHDPLEDACARLRRLAHPGSLVFVISDFNHTSDITIKHLSQIARHCEVVACEITDPMEHELPTTAFKQSLQVTDGSDRKTIFLGDKRNESLYRESATARFVENHEVLKRHKIQLNEITAALPLEEQLQGAQRL